MKFNVSKTVLQNALVLASKCINDKSVIPAMAGFHFSIHGQKIDITGGNMEVYLTTTIDITSKGMDEVKQLCVPITRIMSLLSKLPEQPIDFDIKETVTEGVTTIGLVMKTLSGTYKIPVESGDEYVFITVSDFDEILIPSNGLLSAISRTLFACSTDSLRAQITGVNISFDEGSVNYVSTNTHVMSVQSSFIEKSLDTIKSFIVPPKILSVLQTMEVGPHVKTWISEKHIQFVVDDRTLLKSLLIDGNYIAYENVIPKKNDKNLVLDRSAILSAMKRVSEFASGSVIKITVRPSEIQLTAENLDLAEFADEKMAIDYQGEEFSICVDGALLSKCVAKYDRETIHFSFKEPNTPMLIRSEYKDLTLMKNLMLIMPCIIQEN
ncbi:DNA polymerase-3 subunit beta [Pedobacter sp. AK013]|uniref:DNA polymerase III subunit beta n=1 Tax=Pedobacter sp. AK013 TaxID=2723071 RepID=UPI0016203AE3|nr:DNA polymerase III subunit beta [Pedobacter sp. AK013]MBB6236531.1 DNA polymerase-3 subunit beta [Pedobacter sp. AK013]